MGKQGKKLHFKGSSFHRVIPGTVVLCDAMIVQCVPCGLLFVAVSVLCVCCDIHTCAGNFNLTSTIFVCYECE
jgi:hypothetical protein